LFELRPATAADFPAIRALIHQVGINPTGLGWPRFVVAVEESGCVLGCGQVKLHRDGSRDLASIAVAPEWRDRHVARTIIEYLLDKHPRPLYLTCRASLGAFYARFGFRALTASEMPSYFRRIAIIACWLKKLKFFREDLLVMCLFTR
jgi:N-acetylglutamate synthase-like GNAT family acetyltransferase